MIITMSKIFKDRLEILRLDSKGWTNGNAGGVTSSRIYDTTDTSENRNTTHICLSKMVFDDTSFLLLFKKSDVCLYLERLGTCKHKFTLLVLIKYIKSQKEKGNGRFLLKTYPIVGSWTEITRLRLITRFLLFSPRQSLRVPEKDYFVYSFICLFVFYPGSHLPSSSLLSVYPTQRSFLKSSSLLDPCRLKANLLLLTFLTHVSSRISTKLHTLIIGYKIVLGTLTYLWT